MLPNNRQDFAIQVSDAALKQIALMQENDFTLEGMKFRLKIGGKGCDGFTYDTGFSHPLADDIELLYGNLSLLLDPFTAFYCKSGNLDYLLNPANNEDGFVFVNADEEKYHGKFFKDPSMAPPVPEEKG